MNFLKSSPVIALAVWITLCLPGALAQAQQVPPSSDDPADANGEPIPRFMLPPRKPPASQTHGQINTETTEALKASLPKTIPMGPPRPYSVTTGEDFKECTRDFQKKWDDEQSAKAKQEIYFNGEHLEETKENHDFYMNYNCGLTQEGSDQANAPSYQTYATPAATPIPLAVAAAPEKPSAVEIRHIEFNAGEADMPTAGGAAEEFGTALHLNVPDMPRFILDGDHLVLEGRLALDPGNPSGKIPYALLSFGLDPMKESLAAPKKPKDDKKKQIIQRYTFEQNAPLNRWTISGTYGFHDEYGIFNRDHSAGYYIPVTLRGEAGIGQVYGRTMVYLSAVGGLENRICKHIDDTDLVCVGGSALATLGLLQAGLSAGVNADYEKQINDETIFSVGAKGDMQYLVDDHGSQNSESPDAATLHQGLNAYVGVGVEITDGKH